MVSLVNTVGFLIGCYFLSKSILLIKQKKEDVQGFLIWSTVGISLLILTLVPQIGDFLADYLEIRTRANTIFTIAICLLYVLLFQMHTQNRLLERQISKLNEEISILQYEIKKRMNM